MEELRSLVAHARASDLDAYGEIVRRFQDMAFGYSYALLGDFHLADDAAQEASIQAYRDLAKLDNPAAFPGWFRRVVFKHCDRLTRRKRVTTVPLESAEDVASAGPGPAAVAERREMAEAVLAAIRALPDDERTATALIYINGYSQQEVAEFLEVPVTTVNDRLHSSRERLRERMMAMVEDELKGSRPGPELHDRVMRMISQVEVRPEVTRADEARVLLVDDRGRGLMVCIGKTEEFAIHRALSKTAPPRPMTQELFVSALQAFGIAVKEVRVTDLRDGVYIAELVLRREGEERVLDSRPSDAVALALMTGARITVAESVLQEGGARPASSESEREHLWEMVPKAGEVTFNDDLKELSDRLTQLVDEAFTSLVREVGIGTVALALAAQTQMTEEARAGWRMSRIGPTRTAASREGLPEDLAAALSAVWDRISRLGLSLDDAALPQRYGPEEAIKARDPLRRALRKLLDRSVFPGPDGYALGEPPPSAP